MGAVQQAMDTMKVRSLELKEQVTVFGAVCVDFIKMVLDQLLKKGQVRIPAFGPLRWGSSLSCFLSAMKRPGRG